MTDALEAAAPGPVNLELGMLLLDPGTEDGPPTIWSVKSVDEYKGEHGAAMLVAHKGDFWLHLTLARGIPAGWVLLKNRALADLAIEASQAATSSPTEASPSVAG